MFLSGVLDDDLLWEAGTREFRGFKEVIVCIFSDTLCMVSRWRRVMRMIG